MAVSLKTIEMWSEKEQKFVSWSITTVDDETTVAGQNPDGTPIRNKVVVLKYKDEEQRYSPNTTDAEMERHAKQNREEHS